ncbi:hypothetical protein ABZ413_35560 [Nocardia rhamnosiphila]|uniref:hypothetical protein n=1 Tax=Nocardia rhamnosiphila TaxID=426716 RepID=UPI0033DFB339
MVNILSLDAVKAIVGDAAGALTVMTDDVGTTMDSPALLNGGTQLDVDTRGVRDLVRDLFAAWASDVTEQAGITREATGYGTTVLANADDDGSATVRSSTA